jgi:uncharacterized membrane protein YfcA
MSLLLLFAVGCLAGTLNVLAGGGSFLTLPVLLFLGLPAPLANGTNRVAILLQNTGAVWSFSRQGVLDRGALLWAALPATAGAVLGAWLALDVGELAFRRLLAVLMVVLSAGSLWSPRRRKVARRPAWMPLAFFAVGVYGGFIQAGVGFLVLAVTTAAGLDLVRGNAVKVLAILCWTVAALGVFAAAGSVDWQLGAALAAGNLAGGVTGARLTVLKGHRWVKAVVTVTAILFALGLWLGVGRPPAG